jgi:lipopolysaccharide transport system ATP-binding protein
VGTGFHPELTGRENIYLNGAILGMRRKEIEGKFDEIVAFAEVEKFLDTPVKRYSSGMYVRLAFAVAAHLDPEILVVDEVLAVGDGSFQKKCLGKMDEVAGSGRTVLLVSHNMGAIKSLASKAVLLNGGEVREVGKPEAVVNHYLASSGTNTSDGFFDGAYIDSHRVHLPKYVGQIKLKSVRVKDTNRRTSGAHLEGSDILMEIEFSSSIDAEAIEVFVRVRTMEGQLVFTCLPGKKYLKVLPGAYRALIGFNSGPLLPGIYRGDVVLLSNIPQDNISPAFQFEILSHPRQKDDYRVELLPSLSPAQGSAQAALGIIRMESFWEGLQRVEGP